MLLCGLPPVRRMEYWGSMGLFPSGYLTVGALVFVRPVLMAVMTGRCVVSVSMVMFVVMFMAVRTVVAMLVFIAVMRVIMRMVMLVFVLIAHCRFSCWLISGRSPLRACWSPR